MPTIEQNIKLWSGEHEWSDRGDKCSKHWGRGSTKIIMNARSKVLLVVGSPEAIKMAPVILVMRNNPQAFKVTLCATGQQLQMILQALAEFGLEAGVIAESCV